MGRLSSPPQSILVVVTTKPRPAGRADPRPIDTLGGDGPEARMTRLHPWRTVLTLFVLVGPLAPPSLAQVALELGGQVGSAARSTTTPVRDCSSVGMGACGSASTSEPAPGIRCSSLTGGLKPFESRANRKPSSSPSGGGGNCCLPSRCTGFAQAERVRPYVGLSLGIRVDEIAKRCEPISCDQINAQFGRQVTTASHGRHYSGGVIGGLSIQPAQWLKVETMIGVHDRPGENYGIPTTEFAILLGFVPWRSSGHGP